MQKNFQTAKNSSFLSFNKKKRERKKEINKEREEQSKRKQISSVRLVA